MLERLNNENMESKIFFDKLHIQINELTAIVKRKIIDLLVFSLLKKRKNPSFSKKNIVQLVALLKKCKTNLLIIEMILQKKIKKK